MEKTEDVEKKDVNMRMTKKELLEQYEQLSQQLDTPPPQAKDWSTYQITPEETGLKRVSSSDLKGGELEENTRILERILRGEDRSPKRDLVVLNAASGLMVSGVKEDFASAVKEAVDQIDSGRAYQKLQALIEFTQQG